MAKITIKQLSEITGISPKNLHTYAGRPNKLIKENKLIDLDNPINSLFIERNSAKGNVVVEKEVKDDSKAKAPAKKIDTKKPTKKATTKPKAAPKPTIKEKIVYKEASELLKLELEQKRALLKKTLSTNRNEEIKTQRLEGSLLPRDQVLEVTTIHFNNLTTQFDIALDQMLDFLIVSNVLSRPEAIELKKEKDLLVNKAIEASRIASENDLEKIAEEQKTNRKYNV